MENRFVLKTDEGGNLEVWPDNDGNGIMLRIEPRPEPAKVVDSVGYFKNRDEELRALAQEILRLLPPPPCDKCGRKGK